MNKRLRVREIEPYFLDSQGTADFLGICRKTVANELSAGTFPVRPVYRNSKPLFRYSALVEYAKALESNSDVPAKRRGRKRGCSGAVKGESRAVNPEENKNPAGRRGDNGRTSQGGVSI